MDMLYTVIEVHVYYRSEIGENDRLSTRIVFKDYYIHISVVIEGPLVQCIYSTVHAQWDNNDVQYVMHIYTLYTTAIYTYYKLYMYWFVSMCSFRIDHTI